MHLDVCKSCGGGLERIGNYYVCKFCGSKWTIDADQDVHVIDRANAWSALRDCDFERACELFENIIFKEPENHEAYWGRALANAGIMYVTDYVENKKVPTCNSISESSFIARRDVKKAIELAPKDIAESYKAQAEQIEAIRVEWVKKASREPAYDVFISYKDGDRENGIERTDDSYDAHELYNALTAEGYKVFFSRVSLRSKVSEHYEPYIYNALKTAKVMIVFGERPEYFNAVWVKNEWTRFRAMIERGEKDKNSLVTVYKNMSPNDLPAGLRSRQSLDASEIKFFDILKNHIDKIINAPKERTLVDDFVPEPPKKKKKWPIIVTIAGILALAITLGFVAPNFINVKSDGTTSITEETELEDTETELGSNQESQAETNGSGETEEQSETNFETSLSTEIPTNTESKTETEIKTETETETETNNNFVVENTEYNIKLTLSGSTLPQNTILSVNKVSSGNQLTEIQNALSDSASKFYAYDMNLSVHGNVIQPNGTVTITMPLPTDISQAKATIYYIASDYSVNEITSRVDGGYISFETSHFSVYVIAEKKDIPSSAAIKFEANGGEGIMDSIISSCGASFVLPQSEFERDGYTFTGWATSASGSVVYQNGANFAVGTAPEYTLYAVWTANNNSLILKANNGTSNEKTVNIKTDESKQIPANTFTRGGYTFVGWSTASDGDAEYENEAIFNMSTDSVTLYAIWAPNENKIIFDANGGSGSMSNQTIKTNESANLNECIFVCEGYTFAGWATSATGSVLYQDASEYVMGVNSQYVLYAVWIVCDYSITYVLNGGSNNLSNPAGYNVTSNTIVLQNPTRAGYTFNGWYTDSSFGTECDTITAGSTGDKTFYASWTPNQNTVKFNANGGSGSMSSVTVATNGTTKLPQNTFVRTGYEFAGWATSSSGSVAYSDKATYAMGTDSSYTLYAVWNVVNYTISYDTDGGSISGHQTSYNTNTSTFTLPTPEKEDYIFLGWSGTGISGIQKTVTVTKGSTGDREYTANWELNAYAITLDANGGTTDADTVIVKYGENYTIDTPKRIGYIFLGWFGGTDDNSNVYTDANGNSLAAWNKMEGATFYAHWKADFSEGLSYSKVEGLWNGKRVYAYKVTGIGTCTDTTIKIPATVDGYPVMGVSNDAFNGNSKIISIIFPSEYPEDISYIRSMFVNSSYFESGFDVGELAFANCVNLNSISLNVVGYIGSNAFNSCYSLTNVENMRRPQIDNWAFSNCTSLRTITITKYSNSNCSLTGQSIFAGCTSLETIYCEAESQPEDWSVHWNGSEAQVYWGYIPGGCKVDLDYDGADGNADITYRFVENGNTYIFPIPTKTGYTFGGWYYGTTQITNVSGVTLSAWNISNACTLKAKWDPASTSGVKYQKSADGTYAEVIGYEGTGVDVIIADEYDGVPVTRIAAYAFNRHTGLKSITIPDSVTSIGDGAFSNCSSLESISIPFVGETSNVSNNNFLGYIFGAHSYAENSSYVPSSLKNVVITGASAIDQHAFEMCTSLETVTIFNNVTAIGSEAFRNCSSLTTVNIPNSINYIGKNAFYGCSNLKSLIFENTNGWWYSSYATATSGTSISSADLLDPYTAAHNLDYIYSRYYLYRD